MRSRSTLVLALLSCAGLLAAAAAEPDDADAQAHAGTAALMPDGSAVAPPGAPRRVRKAINAGNRIRFEPYVYGGGHRSFEAEGYDCSGAVSYVLHAAGVLKRPRPSGPLGRWGKKGPGRWVTVYANRGHAFVVIAGLRFDTSSAGDPILSGSGPRWRSTPRAGRHYRKRSHPKL